jgi:hypothetical protein
MEGGFGPPFSDVSAVADPTPKETKMEDFEKAFKAGNAQITIVNCTVVSGEIVEEGTVIDVGKDNIADCRYVFGLGKAVLGDQSANFKKSADANKAISGSDLKNKA